MLPQVEFADNAIRPLGIELIPFEAQFGFSFEEPPYLLYSMRPSIYVPHEAKQRLKLLHK
jgi:hypothetical protein